MKYLVSFVISVEPIHTSPATETNNLLQSEYLLLVEIAVQAKAVDKVHTTPPFFKVPSDNPKCILFPVI